MISCVLAGTGGIYSSGFLTFTDNSTYSGDMNVYEGELRVTSEIADSEIIVQNDATLSGTGTTGDVTVLGTLSPGEDGIGILYTGDLAFGPGSNSHFRVNVTADDSDQVDVEGTVELFGEAILDVVGNLQVAGDEVLVLIKNDEYDSIAGTFFELEEGAEVSVGDATYVITYRHNVETGEFGTGNDVALYPVYAGETDFHGGRKGPIPEWWLYPGFSTESREEILQGIPRFLPESDPPAMDDRIDPDTDYYWRGSIPEGKFAGTKGCGSCVGVILFPTPIPENVGMTVYVFHFSGLSHVAGGFIAAGAWNLESYRAYVFGGNHNEGGTPLLGTVIETLRSRDITIEAYLPCPGVFMDRSWDIYKGYPDTFSLEGY